MASGNWKQFGSLLKLDLAIHGTPDGQKTQIYANSMHMVEAIITVELHDNDGKPLNVTDDQLRKALYFCHYETGQEIKSPWMISDEPNEYIIDTSDKLSDTGNLRYVSKYISCADHKVAEITDDISVGIDVPGVGKFDTSRNGTSTKTKSGHIFKSPKSCAIKAIAPINYSNSDNIKIECHDFKTIKDNLRWVGRTEALKTIDFGDTNAKCKRRLVTIRPNKGATGEENFKSYTVEHENVHNSDVSKDTIEWFWDDYYGVQVPAFDLLTNQNDYTKPGAIIGRGYERDEYEVNVWYGGQSRILINGKYTVTDTDKLYRFNYDEDAIDEDHRGENDDGAATLYLYKCTLPLANRRQESWGDVINDFTVKVFDLYGNTGSIRLYFNDSDKFDAPGLR